MLKVVLQMMLSQKIAALFALVFASGVIGRPVGVGAGLAGKIGGAGGGGGLSGLGGGSGGLPGLLGGKSFGGGGGGGLLGGAWYVKYGFASNPSLFFYASI